MPAACSRQRPASQASGLDTQTYGRSDAPWQARANSARRHRARAAQAGLACGMDDDLLIGHSNRGPIRLSVADRRLHAAIFGQTGVGKSTLLKSLILQDIEADRGCMVLDPHGDLADELLEHIPRRRTDAVCVIDPANLGHAVAINPLSAVPLDERHRVAEEIVAVFSAIWELSPSATPRLLHILTNCLAALLDLPTGATLVGLPRLLTDDQWRSRVVRHVRNPQVRAFWEEFEAWPERQREEAIAPIMNKAGALVTSPALYNTLGQATPTVRPERLMDGGMIVVCNLSKGRLGETSAHLLGALLLASFDLAARRRAAVPEAERRDFTIYVDELASFAGHRLASLLSESRKYALSFVGALQFTAQLPEVVRASLFGNVGTIVSFRIGADDAEPLGRLLEWSPTTLRELGRGEIIARTVAGGVIREPVMGMTAPYAGARAGRGANIRAQSATRYARPRAVVEGRLLRWLAGRTTSRTSG